MNWKHLALKIVCYTNLVRQVSDYFQGWVAELELICTFEGLGLDNIYIHLANYWA